MSIANHKHAEKTAGITMVPEFSTVLDRHVDFTGMATLTVKAPERFQTSGFKPGQFNMLYAFGVGEIAISISGDPDNRSVLTHTIRDVGLVSRALGNIKAGEQIGIRGPFGTGWPVDNAESRDVIIVAGGLGLAPVRPAVHYIVNQRERFGRVALIYGARSPEELIYDDVLDNWSKHGIDVRVTVDHATEKWHGEIGLVTHLLPALDINFDSSVSFICGPEIMMRHTAIELEALGADAKNIHLSMERNMKCALAWCGHCQFGSHFVCKDGPVYSYATLRDMLTIREL